MRFRDAHFPPGFDKGVLLRAPRRIREDMLQEAWLAFLQGRDPTTRAKNFRKKEARYERRMIPMSTLLFGEQEDCEEDGQ